MVGLVVVSLFLSLSVPQTERERERETTTQPPQTDKENPPPNHLHLNGKNIPQPNHPFPQEGKRDYHPTTRPPETEREKERGRGGEKHIENTTQPIREREKGGWVVLSLYGMAGLVVAVYKERVRNPRLRSTVCEARALFCSSAEPR